MLFTEQVNIWKFSIYHDIRKENMEKCNPQECYPLHERISIISESDRATLKQALAAIYDTCKGCSLRNGKTSQQIVSQLK